ncbi:MAG: helix-turn-helix domain-containing protein [Phycisphaerae bacterium]|nr:helix-turn-helix domain-containing protein [Phycisphaerae bacterium]NUQ45935.1 helix-turn-helix domain-containing protein [Phycisphaerae bacterium]
MAKPIEERRCHVCGQHSRRREKRPFQYEISHDGRPPVTIRIPDLDVIVCANPNCRPENPDDTVIEDDDAAHRITIETYRQLGLLTPDEIRTQREALGLTQQQMQELMGLGGNTLSRWEQARVYQSRAMDRFLRVFFTSAQVREILNRGASTGSEPAESKVTPATAMSE